MFKLTIMVHPGGKFWSTLEGPQGCQLVFGKTGTATQHHPTGYTAGKKDEKIRKGYIMLIDNQTLNSGLGSNLDVHSLSHNLRDVAISKSEQSANLIAPVLSALLSVQAIQSCIAALKSHFNVAPGVLNAVLNNLPAPQPAPAPVPEPEKPRNAGPDLNPSALLGW